MEIPIRKNVTPVLRRALSPKAFEFVRICFWRLSFPTRLAASRFVKRKPEVRGFNSGADQLVAQLQNVNVFAPTKMCRVMTKYGSDKGKRHSYTTVYSALFNGLREQPLRIFETRPRHQ